MNAYAHNYIGADGQSYPEVAAQAVSSIHAQHQSPYYGYIRSGANQKIYLFPLLEDAQGWFGQHTQLQPNHDYAALFSASNLSAPMPGMEHFMRASMSGNPSVGNWWPLLLGLPLGAVGGYFLRRWQEPETTRASVPRLRDAARALMAPAQTPQSTAASGWYDIEDSVGGYSDGYSVGGPWMDLVGAESLAIAKPIAIPVLDEDGNLTGTFVRWFPTQDQISQFGGKRPEFYVDYYDGGHFVYNDARGEPREVGPYLSPPYKMRALFYKPTWQVQFINPSGELTDKQTAYKTADAVYGTAYTEEQQRAQQERIYQALFGQRSRVGGPWLDIVGAQVDEVRRREWPQTRALIQSAIDEVTGYAASYPAEAYVWTLDAPTSAPYAGRTPGSTVILEGTTNVVPFSSQAEALKYLREVAQTQPVALAMFERSSQHWPNPTAWRKSSEAEHAHVIAQHVASRSATQTSGTYTGADTVVGAAIDNVRRRAQQLANKRAGDVIGVIHTSKDGLWHTLAFRSSDDADDWLGTATTNPALYTYAAYFDKEDFQWPHPVNEKVGGARPTSRRGSPGRRAIATTSGDVVGAAIDDYRARAKQIASAKRGNAVGVIYTPGGLWHRFSFTSLDDAIDWLQASTQRDKSSFVYAAAFEKGRDGVAYVQDEEIGGRRLMSRPGSLGTREIATTSGDRWG